MHFNCFVVALMSIITIGIATPVRNRQEEVTTQSNQESRQSTTEAQTGSPYEEEAAVDRRLANSEESRIGFYECNHDSHCAHEGKCVKLGKEGNVCNCTEDFLGPFCDYSARKVKKELRSSPRVKASFLECMTKTGNSANVNSIALFGKCGSGQNLCWFKEGGVKALKCFFWCLSNSMKLSLTEEKPNGESRLKMVEEFFKKFARGRDLQPGATQPRPQGVPVASLQINIYNGPAPGNNRRPTITINPTWTYWTPEETGDETDSETGAVPHDPSSSNSPSTESASPYPSNREANPWASAYGNGDSSYSDYYNYDYGGDDSLNGTLDGAVVEAADESDDTVDMSYMVPFIDTSSNMRG